MGKQAEAIASGDDCQECGQYIGPGDGYPRTCKDCKNPDRPSKSQRRKHHIQQLEEKIREQKATITAQSAALEKFEAFLRGEIEEADAYQHAEKIAGNIVKEEFQKGRLYSAHRMKHQLDALAAIDKAGEGR